MNEADEDDLDVYDARPSQTSRRLAYDADEDDKHIVMGNRSRSTRVRFQLSYVVNRSLLQPAFVADLQGTSY